MRRQPILLRLAILAFVLGGFALFRNLVSTWSTLQEYPNAAFLPVFLSTHSASGGVDPILVYFVWGPLVFGGLGVVLLVIHLLTRGAGVVAVGAGTGAAAATWQGAQQSQQQGGWQPQDQGWSADQQRPGQQQPGWQSGQQQGGWQPEQQPAGWQPEQQHGGWQPEQQHGGGQPSTPSAPFDGTQPPPPNASDRIQP